MSCSKQTISTILFITYKIKKMSTIKVKDGTEIYYKDWGTGQPLVFHHGWPLSGDDWDAQMMFFLNHGYRVIAHDRRGHGRSTQTGIGHDMDTYAADVAELTKALDLKNAIHIGHSTGRWGSDPVCRETWPGPGCQGSADQCGYSADGAG
jgi:pimeloyl-ACP methyl ester carboxylesterase